MANKVTITTNEFAKDGADESLKAAIVVTCNRVHAEAVQNAPVDQGRLRNSIMWAKSWGDDAFNFPDSDGFNSQSGDSAPGSAKIEPGNGLEGYVGSGLEYATYQEFGTRYMPAQPYLRPAGDTVRGKSAGEIAKKWGPEAMRKEYDARKKRTKRYG